MANLINFDGDNSIQIGFDYLINAVFKDEAGVPIDLTGGTLQMIIEDGADNVLLTLDHTVARLSTGIFINDLVLSDFDIQVSIADGITLGAGGYPCEVTFTDSIGFLHRLSHGTICATEGDV